MAFAAINTLRVKYSNDQTQPNTRADPKSEPRGRLITLGVCFGFAFQKSASALGPLWVHSGFAWGPLRVRKGSALCPIYRVRFTHSSVKRTRSVVTVRKPRPLYIPNTFSNISHKSFIFCSNWKHTYLQDLAVYSTYIVTLCKTVLD